jgi:alpha-tubulin suppressor-like RCC1 family protein
MRIPRFVLALLLVGTPVATVAATAASVSADPFTYSQVSLGQSAICVLTTSHEVLCKGDNYNGYLVPDTNDRTITQYTRINLPNGEQWDTIHAGTSNTRCGVAVSGRAFCWGEGRLGSYFTTVSRVPVQVEFPNDIRVREVQAGYSTACAIDISDDLWCWGDANYIGNGDTESMRIPVRVPMPDGSKISTLSMNHANVCVSTKSNRVFCWGGNTAGQLGLGYAQQFPYSYSWLPVSLPTPSGKQWAQIAPAIGIGRICAITTDGAGYCAGDNYGGSFGNNTYNDSMTFVQMAVPNNEAITSISSGNYHTCVTTSAGNFYCVGDGSAGQFGTGTTMSGKTYRSPLLPQGMEIAESSLAGSSTCFLDTNSKIWCTGLINGGPVYNEIDKTNLSLRQIVPIGTPTVATPFAIDIDAETATISGTINPNGYASTATLEIANNSSFINSTRYSLTVNAGDGSYSAASFTRRLTDIAPRTTFYSRVIATNTLGNTTSASSTFTTLGTEPDVSHINTANITGNEAQSSFTVNPGRLSTTISAEFSTDSSFQDNLQSFPLAGANGSQDVARSVNLAGLQPRTRYYARAIATNRLGTTTGTTQSFLTIGSLATISQVAIDTDVRSVSINVTATTGDTSGSVRAEASTTSNFANVFSSASSGFSSSGPTDHQLTVTGLTARTTYFVRVIVTNQIGDTTSSVETIRTLGGAPTVATPVVDPTPRGASLRLQFDANGLDTSVKLIFSAAEDADDPFEHFIRQNDIKGLQTVDYTLYDLRPAVTYYVTLVATNDAGTATSSRVSFTTPSPIGVIINNDDNSTELSTVTLTITPPGGAVAMRVSNNRAFRGAKVLPLTSTMNWELLASDEEIAERTVYVQFYFRNGSSIVFEDDIELMTDVTSPDDEAPTVTAMSAAKTRIAAAATSTVKTASTVMISARDKMSGVVRIETKVKTRVTSTRVEAARRGTYTLSFPKGVKKMQIRVIDKAGNKSKWITVTRK